LHISQQLASSKPLGKKADEKVSEEEDEEEEEDEDEDL
jgi:hypothetical protein